MADSPQANGTRNDAARAVQANSPEPGRARDADGYLPQKPAEGTQTAPGVTLPPKPAEGFDVRDVLAKRAGVYERARAKERQGTRADIRTKTSGSENGSQNHGDVIDALAPRAGDLFGSTLSGSQGPTLEGGVLSGEVTEGEGVVAFEVIQLTDQDTVIGLNAATGNPFSRAYSAQLASEPGVFTSVNLSNRATAERNVKLRAVNEDGSDRGDPVLFTLAPGEQFTEDAGVLFGGGSTPPTLSQGAPFRGSLIVEADGDGIVGDVLFGDPDKFAYAASVPLQTETFKEALFNQVANVFGIFTGLAFFYPGPDAEASPQQGPQGPPPEARITIQVYSPGGQLLGEGELTLAAGERVSQLVEQLVEEVAELELAGGYVLVFSDNPIIGQMLFGQLGGNGIQYFSAVPPTVLR